ncbi:cryptochrome/photolyase family protein [Rhodovulum sp. FJ3]|uniref:cryptochrome/photolyase family protein n=1 Tax=Rhodovulum sp. FJ3 TaxID=3079053 RepID=UPI00293DC467|nr:cryptochrome/photolyase family protein [Rhodovulum sp. FJ3]MDV4168585.1 cryptochrome/photolyase family protein [Rhodovulum sp. FJ3]
MVKRLILILGDQLSPEMSCLSDGPEAGDVVVMAEVADEGTYVPHHPQKITLILSAMRKFADQLRDAGWEVAYTTLDDPDNAGSICGELLRRAEEFETDQVVLTEPGEWRLIDALNDLPLHVEMRQDTRFLASHAEFERWAEGRKSLRMEYFYREMRRKTGLLMDGDDPCGGQWNFDQDNRKPARGDLFKLGPCRFEPDDTVRAVMDLVTDRFDGHFGTVDGFAYATDRDQALQVLDHFIKNALPCFGDYQDAMLADDPVLYHALISPYLNIGLLGWREVCAAAETAYRDGDAPLNAVEGFIRQIIGWREYIRGIYFLKGRDYTAQNTLNHTRDLPAVYWGGDSGMACMRAAVGQTRDLAYAHHIQRLMVTGNFALLAGIDPAQVHEWYLSVYIDAFEWVEAPNTIGMSQFADGGIVASKPYVSSGSYIDRMSDYCGDCAYKVGDKTGKEACPFNVLYWHFLNRHRDRFQGNGRMGMMYRTWDKMDAGKRDAIISDAETVLERLDRGDPV